MSIKTNEKHWYVIRKYNCGYNDEHAYHQNKGKLIYKFLDENAAKRKINELEREVYRNQFAHLGNLLDNFADTFSFKDKAFREYLKSHFEIELDDDVRYGVKPDRNPTDQEIDDLRKIIGFDFYSLTKFNENVNFYVPELNDEVFKDSDRIMDIIRAEQMLTLYLSYSEALEKMVEALLSIEGYHPSIEGELKDISPTPNLLREFIDKTQSITYKNNCLEFQYDSRVPIIINDLLNKKPIIVNKKSLVEIESIKN